MILVVIVTFTVLVAEMVGVVSKTVVVEFTVMVDVGGFRNVVGVTLRWTLYTVLSRTINLVPVQN